MSHQVRFTIGCPETDRCSVFFEPEGAEILITKFDLLTVEIRGGKGTPEIELAYLPKGIVVWAWANAETTVWDRSGRQLDI